MKVIFQRSAVCMKHHTYSRHAFNSRWRKWITFINLARCDDSKNVVKYICADKLLHPRCNSDGVLTSPPHSKSLSQVHLHLYSVQDICNVLGATRFTSLHLKLKKKIRKARDIIQYYVMTSVCNNSLVPAEWTITIYIMVGVYICVLFFFFHKTRDRIFFFFFHFYQEAIAALSSRVQLV